MKAPDLRSQSASDANPRTTGQRPRRRFMVLLAASAATLAGCGGDEPSTPGGYKFPGARKDETGNYKMRNI